MFNLRLSQKETRLDEGTQHFCVPSFTLKRQEAFAWRNDPGMRFCLLKLDEDENMLKMDD